MVSVDIAEKEGQKDVREDKHSSLLPHWQNTDFELSPCLLESRPGFPEPLAATWAKFWPMR